jgi:transcriptional regulator with XRE-family HTH domain
MMKEIEEKARKTMTTKQYLSRGLTKSNIQKILLEYRLNEGLTLLEMSNKIDLSQQTLFNLEKGKTNPRNTTIYKINKALGTKIPFIKQKDNVVYL